MNEKKRRLPLIALSIALAAVSGIAGRSVFQAEQLRSRLREIYDGAALAALRQTEDMQLALSKALLSQDEKAEAQYLSQVSAGAAQVQRSLSLLPLSHTATQSAVKFANQAADYTASLLKGNGLTAEDAARLSAMIDTCGQYAAALFNARDALSDRAVSGADTFYPDAAEQDAPAYDSAVSYPTLIYDGPFSDARDTGSAKGLSGRTITWEEATAAARDFIGADRVKRALPAQETGGSIPCFGVTLELSDVTVHAAVTKQGGKVLWMAPEKADFSPLRSVEECRDAALQFLDAQGFHNMQPTYFQVYQGVAVISFAATQGETLLYPDLIKVQCRLDTAQVVGIEARNYWQNHTARGLLVPRLSAEEAREKVSGRLNISSFRLCLIPTDSGEKLCYEFQGDYLGRTYLSYINALDGRQEQLLKVVESAAGLEAV